MGWSLADIRTKIRALTGRPSSTQISDANILIKINNYYQFVFPFEVNVHEFEGFTELSTVDGTETYTVPDGIKTINIPVTITDSDGNANFLDLYTNRLEFFQAFPDADNDEADEKDQPQGMFVYGRTIYLRPVPDAIYTVKYWHLAQLPTAFDGETDTGSDEMWGPAIAYGTSIEILEEAGQDDMAAKIKDRYAFHIGVIATKQVASITEGTRSRPRF